MALCFVYKVIMDLSLIDHAISECSSGVNSYILHNNCKENIMSLSLLVGTIVTYLLLVFFFF